MDNNKGNVQYKNAFQSINFDHLDKFHPDLEFDEIVLMQYLIYHCNTNRGKWFHSAADIETSLRIKKHRLKIIVDDFEKKEWISVKKGGSKNRRTFRVNFERLCTMDFLTQYYDYPKLSDLERNEVAEVFIDYLKNYRSHYSKLVRSILYPVSNESYENLLVLIEREFRLLELDRGLLPSSDENVKALVHKFSLLKSAN